MRKVLWISGIALVLFAGFMGFLWYQADTAKGLSVDMTVPAQVQVGVPFQIVVIASNDSSNVLDNTDLTLVVPDSMMVVGYAGKTFITKNIGSLGSGGISREEYTMVALSGENSLASLKATVSYLPVSIGSRFEQNVTKEISIAESGMTLDISAPQKVFSGEEVTLNIKYHNVSSVDFSGLTLKVDYPSTFSFKSSSRDADTGDNEWDLGDLRQGSEGELTITGVVTGPDNAFFDFKASILTSYLSRTYAIAQKTATVSLSPSPLSLDISLAGGNDYITQLKDSLNYTIHYKNNTTVGLKDAIISAKLSGEMFDFPTIGSNNGTFQSADQTMMWNASQVSDLSVIPPGGEGTVSFRINVKDAYPIRRVSDRNFLLKVTAQIESPTVPAGVASGQAVGQASIQTKVAGAIQLSSFGMYNDSSSGISNKGPIPPKVGKATQYTIHWQLINTSTDMENVTIRAFLGPNVRYTSSSKSVTGVLPTYNERTQEMVWEIPKVFATQGTLSPAPEAIFQVELVPSVDQVNRFARLIGETTLTATDSFTGQSVTVKAEAVDTTIQKDTSVGAQNGIVVQ